MSSQSTNSPYQAKLKVLIHKGERLLNDCLDPEAKREIRKEIEQLKTKLFKAEIEDQKI